MPLVRVEVQNEYGLGGQELYEATDKDDPKAVLDGVAVAGLVGILRQLGDLAEFAAEVFHDLQEQLMFTVARSRKMIVRVQHIEVALLPLENAVMSQTSHLHFAYTAGSIWHPSIRTKRNHFIHSDLPRFIMNSYEECRDPPHLHMLDKFDTGGSGACLRRYSDPSFFKKALAGSDTFNAEKVLRAKKATKTKKKGSRRKNGSISWNSGRVPFTSSSSFGQNSATESPPTFHTRSKSEVIDRSLSFDLRTRLGYIECVFGASSSSRHGDQEDLELPSSNLKMQHRKMNNSVHFDEKRTGAKKTGSTLHNQNAFHLTSVNWDEKIEITVPKSQISQKLAEHEHGSQFSGISCDIKHFSGASLTENRAHEEQKGFSALDLNSGQKVVDGFIHKDELRADDNDNPSQGLLQDKCIPSPTYVTWHEKVEIEERTSQQSHDVLESETEVQLLSASTNVESTFNASLSMDNGDEDHEELSASIFKMQDGDTIGCSGLHELKIDGTACLTRDSLEELNLSCGSIVSRDDFITSTLKNQGNVESGSWLPDQKEDTINNLAYELPIEQNTSQVSSFDWRGRMEIVEVNTQRSNSSINDKTEGQLLSQRLEFSKLEKDAAMHGIVSMENIAWDSVEPCEDDQFDEDGSGTDKYVDALNTLESESETDSECQPMQGIKHVSAKPIDSVSLEVLENLQNSEEAKDDFVNTAPASVEKLFSNPIYSEDFVHVEPPLIADLSGGPDIFEVNDNCEKTDGLDVSVVNAFDSFTKVTSSSVSSICDSEEMLEHCRDVEATIGECLCRSPGSSKEFSKLPYSEDSFHAEPSHISGLSSPDTSDVSFHNKATGDLEVSGGIAFKSSVNVLSSFVSCITNSQDPVDTVLLGSLSESQEPSTEISDSSSIKVWTNGSLLGLEPSKPLRPSVSTVVNNDFTVGSNENKSNLSSGTLMTKSLSNGSVTKLNMLEKKHEQVEKNTESGPKNISTDIACLNALSGQTVKGSMNVVQTIDHLDSSKFYYDKPDDENETNENNSQILSAAVESKFGKWENLPQAGSFDDISQNSLIKSSPVKSLAELSSVNDLNVPNAEGSQDNIRNPSTNFGLGVANGKTPNGSFHNGEYEVANLMKVDPMKLNTPDFSERKGKAGVGEKGVTLGNPREELENGSLLNTCASPRLEHMKISFHPIDAFATSKLILKFPGVHHFHESIKDVMFPSFHLLPESDIAIQDIESESDDDTFYRSTPCISDNDMSQQSESSFEQWEPGEIPELKDNEIYDALHRISSDESISNAFELCEIGNSSTQLDNAFKDHQCEHWLEPMHHNHSFDLPTVDAVNPFKNPQEKMFGSDSQHCANTVPQLCNESTPPSPPPLPPAQWWVTKSNFNALENGHYVVMSNGAIHSDEQIPEVLSLLSSSSKPSPYVTRSQDPQLNGVNGHGGDDQTVNGKEMDNREDLMFQIRTKSFNLRRAVPTLRHDASGPKTNTKVAAMLEKAQAIGQAYVGSNEAVGDESWSDG